MPDNHNHSHHHGIEAGEAKGSRLLAVIALNFIITAAQTAAGIFAGSLSLISDSLHNFSDGMAVIISYLALRIAGRGNDKRRTFGYKRATILAALVNSSVLAVISVFLFREAYGRFQHPREVDGGLVIWVALVGLAANALGAWLLHGHSKGDINLKASYLHLISDTLSSVGVVIGGMLICLVYVLVCVGALKLFATKNPLDLGAAILGLATCAGGIAAQFIEGTKPAPSYEWGRTLGLVLAVLVAIWAAVAKKDVVAKVAQHATEH